MIKASELRINNLFSTGPNILKVQKIEHVFEVGGDYFMINDVYREEDIFPVILTEEQLIKFGAIDKTHIDSSKYPFGKYKNTSSFGGIAFNYQTNGIQLSPKFEIKYAHSFQNLYFALTGKEL